MLGRLHKQPPGFPHWPSLYALVSLPNRPTAPSTTNPIDPATAHECDINYIFLQVQLTNFHVNKKEVSVAKLPDFQYITILGCALHCSVPPATMNKLSRAT